MAMMCTRSNTTRALISALKFQQHIGKGQIAAISKTLLWWLANCGPCRLRLCQTLTPLLADRALCCLWVAQDTLAREFTGQRVACLAAAAALKEVALPAFASACAAVSTEQYWDGQRPAAAAGALRRRSQLLDLLMRTTDHQVLRVR